MQLLQLFEVKKKNFNLEQIPRHKENSTEIVCQRHKQCDVRSVTDYHK